MSTGTRHIEEEEENEKIIHENYMKNLRLCRVVADSVWYYRGGDVRLC